MNANAVLEWVKSNVFIVVFVVLMLAALIALPLIARGMNAEIAQDVDRRARKLNDMAQLERTQVSAPGGAAMGETQQAVVNERLLQAFRANVRQAQEDADLVHARALEHNRKGRGVLMEQVFPAPPPRLAEVMPRRFYERMQTAYDDLFADVKAGSPPPLENLREDIERREIQFRTHTLAKEADDTLTDEEQRELRNVLTGLRLLRYEEAASRIKMYASRDALELPRWDESRLPSMAEMFDWQWRYWIHEDLLRALYQANENSPSVLEAPVKHLLFADVSPMGGGRSGDSGPSRGVMGAGMTGGDGGGGGGGGSPNPRTEAPLDFSVSLTGRTTNSLYDVRYIDLELVVDTNRIPEVLDALSRYNFMTVLQLRTTPADPYFAAASGYFYGPSPVSLLSLRLETVWFREWTSEFMPDAIKEQLGIPTAATASY